MPAPTPTTFVGLAFAIQFVLLVLYGCFVGYADNASAFGPGVTEMDHIYPMYQDVHVMIFVGFGFLMTFLKKYGFSAVGYNFLLSAVILQWAILVVPFWHQVIEGHYHNIDLDIKSLVGADFAAGSVMISFGALLGKATPVQLLVMGMCHICFYSLNEAIGAAQLQAVDMGGSMFVHMFGAYFGLGTALALGWMNKNASPEGVKKYAKKNGSNKTSDMFAMIGTIFLWMFWPSFNGALATGNSQQRVAINTVIALAACTTTAYAASMLLRGKAKFNMIDIQNATLAGGVAVGSSADLMVQPWGAMLIGMIAGFVSVLGYIYVQPMLERLGVHDTCGVHNLHGMPGFIGALAGCISAGAASENAYGENIGLIFPARAPSNATLAAKFGVDAGKDRTARGQALIQFCTCMITFGISMFGGILVGCFIGSPIFTQQTDNYDDDQFWEIEGESDEEEHTQEMVTLQQPKSADGSVRRQPSTENTEPL